MLALVGVDDSVAVKVPHLDHWPIRDKHGGQVSNSPPITAHLDVPVSGASTEHRLVAVHAETLHRVVVSLTSNHSY